MSDSEDCAAIRSSSVPVRGSHVGEGDLDGCAPIHDAPHRPLCVSQRLPTCLPILDRFRWKRVRDTDGEQLPLLSLPPLLLGHGAFV